MGKRLKAYTGHIDAEKENERNYRRIKQSVFAARYLNVERKK